MKTHTIQISAGKGPAKCCWVVAQVLKQLLTTLKKEQLDYQILERNSGPENGCLQSATLTVRGKNATNVLAPWLGTVQWIGQSMFRKYHKRRNWFVGIYELDKVQTIELREVEVQFQAIRSSGPGGQHVNKVSSAVRATHLKTGLFVMAMDSRSQHQNKKLALKRLKQKVLEYNTANLSEAVKNQWENHLQLERGNPVKVFKGRGFKQQ